MLLFAFMQDIPDVGPKPSYCAVIGWQLIAQYLYISIYIYKYLYISILTQHSMIL